MYKRKIEYINNENINNDKDYNSKRLKKYNESSMICDDNNTNKDTNPTKFINNINHINPEKYVNDNFIIKRPKYDKVNTYMDIYKCNIHNNDKEICNLYECNGITYIHNIIGEYYTYIN